MERLVKPFDIKEAQHGATIETRGGRKVKFICYNTEQSLYPIMVAVKYKDWVVHFYNQEGRIFSVSEDESDLVLVQYVEKKPSHNARLVMLENKLKKLREEYTDVTDKELRLTLDIILRY